MRACSSDRLPRSLAFGKRERRPACPGSAPRPIRAMIGVEDLAIKEQVHELESRAQSRMARHGRPGRHRDHDRAAGARHRRLRGEARPASARAPHGRAVHLLRSDGAGRIRHRPGDRRQAAPAYRARHRDLSLPRRAPAPRQPRLEPDDPSRRRQLDGGRKGHHPFRAHRRRPARRRTSSMASRLGSPCRRRTRTTRRVSPTTPATTCPNSWTAASACA